MLKLVTVRKSKTDKIFVYNVISILVFPHSITRIEYLLNGINFVLFGKKWSLFDLLSKLSYISGPQRMFNQFSKVAIKSSSNLDYEINFRM